jgi:hypothetical protein
MLFLYSANDIITRFEIWMIGMAHVDAEHVNTSQEELFDHFLG